MVFFEDKIKYDQKRLDKLLQELKMVNEDVGIDFSDEEIAIHDEVEELKDAIEESRSELSNIKNQLLSNMAQIDKLRKTKH